MDQYALDYGLVCRKKISLGAHKMHGFPGKMNTFNLGACSTVSHKRVSSPQMQDPTASSSQETGKPQWTTFVQNQVFAAGESAPDRPPYFSVCRVPGAASATVPQPFSSGPDLAEAQLWSRAESLAASKCLSRQVHPDGGCRVLNLPGFPKQHSFSIKNTCQSQKVHLGPDSQGSPVLCVGCL